MSRFQRWIAAWACAVLLLAVAVDSRAADAPAPGEAGAKLPRHPREIPGSAELDDKIRRIGFAFLLFEDANRRNHRFPARAIFDKEGKPLLSWRVRILAFIGEKELFRQFHLDEPWDSEHNKALITKMPDIYLRPGRSNDGKTTFLVPVGKGLAFDGTEGLTIGSFDEVRMTIMMVDANDDRAVIWTKPDDLEVDTQKPKNGLGDALDGGFDVLFGDGHIDFLRKGIKPTTLNSLFRVRRRTD